MADFASLGGVKITGFISPTDTNDNYAVIDPLYGIGGFRVLGGSAADLNNIPELRRRAGMFVGVDGGTNYYKLLPKGLGWSFNLSDWELVDFEPNPTNVTGGTYDIHSGVVIFTNASGDTFNVSGFTSGMTDSYTTTATTSGNTIIFTNNVLGSNLYNVDLTTMLSGATPWVSNGVNSLLIKQSNSTNNSNHSITAGENNTINNSNYSTIGGGVNNQIGDSTHSFIGGGVNNQNNQYSTYSTVGGGVNNHNYHTTHSFIGGGVSNYNYDSNHSTIGGGQNNLNNNSSTHSTIGGGQNNHNYQTTHSFIGGGQNNLNNYSNHSTVGGGRNNLNNDSSDHSTVGGGQNNLNNYSNHSTISGGMGNKNFNSSNHSTIGGGQNNQNNNSSSYSTIGGGVNNLNNDFSSYSTIGGGQDNQNNNSTYSTIGGGQNNHINNYSSYSFIGGGQDNQNNNSIYSTIGGGQNNLNNNSTYSTIGGGQNNVNGANYSSIGGGQGNNTIHSNTHIMGSNITTISADTTYVEQLNIKVLPFGDATDDLLSVSPNGIVTRQLSSNAKFGLTYFVAETGDDLTGARGDITKPFKTISSARNKVVSELSGGTISGSTLIYVFPGSYVDDELQYDNGNFYFSPGSKVTAVVRSQVSGTTTSLFNIGGTPLHSPQYSATTCNIFGQGEFFLPQSSDNDWNGTIVTVSNSGATYFECHSFIVEQGIGLVALDNASGTFKGNYLGVETSGYIATVRDSTNTVFDFRRIYNNGGGWPFFIRHGNQPNFTGSCVISADVITGFNGWSTIRIFKLGAGGEVIINSPKIISNNAYCVEYQQNSGGEVIINGNLYSEGTGGAIYTNSNSGGSLTLNGNCQSPITAFEFNNGNLVDNLITFNGDINIVGGSTSGIDLFGGTLRLNGTLFNTISGGTTNNGITLNDSAKLIIDTFKIITDNTSIISVPATTPNYRVIHSLASNKAVGVGLTNLVVGSNIIIDSNIE